MKHILFSIIIVQFFSAVTCTAQVKTYRVYYKNGAVKSIKHQGIFAGCGVPVGTDSLFHPTTGLAETTTYVHIKDQKESSCHAIRTYFKKMNYQDGKRTPVIKYCTSGYESEPLPCTEAQYLNAKQISGTVRQKSRLGTKSNSHHRPSAH